MVKKSEIIKIIEETPNKNDAIEKIKNRFELSENIDIEKENYKIGDLTNSLGRLEKGSLKEIHDEEIREKVRKKYN